MSQPYTVQLTSKIRKRFSKNELGELCFQLGISSEDIEGDTRNDKARHLVEFYERENRLQDLVAVCKKMRPNENWEEETEEPSSEEIFLPSEKREEQAKISQQMPVRSNIAPWFVRYPGVMWALIGLAIGVLVMGLFSLGGWGRGVGNVTPTVTKEAEVVIIVITATETATDLPANTPEPLPTDTPLPTNTATDIPPTYTVTHTNTPVPKDTATPTHTATPVPPTYTPTPGIGSTRIRPADEAVMMFVPAGEFAMGSEDGGDDEKPIHAVYLDSYWIDQTEVTNGMYAECERTGVCDKPAILSSNTHNSYYTNPEYANYPVIHMSWEDANTYCEWAGGRLPTEAEWEKAARWDEANQVARTYPWGEEIDCNYANYSLCVGDTMETGSYLDGASPYGVLDMAGNAWEWVYDWYDNAYYQKSPYENPQGAESGAYRVLRGGAWNNLDYGARAADRDSGGNPGFRYNLVGFRCAQE